MYEKWLNIFRVTFILKYSSCQMNLILHNPQHVGFETDCRRLKAGVERVLKAGKVKRKYVCMLLWSPLFFLHNRVFFILIFKNKRYCHPDKDKRPGRLRDNKRIHPGSYKRNPIRNSSLPLRKNKGFICVRTWIWRVDSLSCILCHISSNCLTL